MRRLYTGLAWTVAGAVVNEHNLEFVALFRSDRGQLRMERREAL